MNAILNILVKFCYSVHRKGERKENERIISYLLSLVPFPFFVDFLGFDSLESLIFFLLISSQFFRPDAPGRFRLYPELPPCKVLFRKNFLRITI